MKSFLIVGLGRLAPRWPRSCVSRAMKCWHLMSFLSGYRQWPTM